MRIQFTVLFRGLIMAVVEISSFQEQAISRQGINQLESSFGFIFLWLPMKEAKGDHIPSRQGKPTALSDCPDKGSK